MDLMLEKKKHMNVNFMGKREEVRKILNEIEDMSESFPNPSLINNSKMKPHRGEMGWKKYAREALFL